MLFGAGTAVNTLYTKRTESFMELPKNIMNEELIAAEVELDQEETEDLIYECYHLLQRMLERTNPQWLQNEGLALAKRLEVALSWHKLH